MKREFTLKGKRICKAVVTLALLLCSTIAQAGDDEWFCFSGRLQAYPSGAGKVYAEVPETYATADALGMPFSDMQTPSESVLVRFVTEASNALGTATAYYQAFAQPADGWLFAGFSPSVKNASDEFISMDSLAYYSSPQNLYIPGYISDKDSLSAIGMMPLGDAVDTVHYALFTHIAPRIAPGQERLGTVVSSKMCNDLGDNVTLTAIPTNTKTTKFGYWLNKMTKEQSTENPLTINNISGCAYYEAHFECDSAIVMDFPEEGGYKMVYFDKGYSIPGDSVVSKSFTFFKQEASDDSEGYIINNLEKNEDNGKFFQEPTDASYTIYGHEPNLLYGRGKLYFVEDPDADENSYSSSELKWSGDQGVKTDTLAATCKYYSVDIEKEQFTLLNDGAVIAPQTAYFALPVESYTALEGVTEAPKVIYWNDPTTTGISNTKAEVSKKNVTGIYNLKGQKLNDIKTSGLYIVNGKKVYKLN